MKKLALTTALVLGAAAPALAQTQLEASLGVDAGQFTLNELVQLKNAASIDSNNDARVFIDNEVVRFSASDAHNGTAQDIFARIAAESAQDE